MFGVGVGGSYSIGDLRAATATLRRGSGPSLPIRLSASRDYKTK